MGKLYTNTNGAVIDFEFDIDLSSATNIEIFVKKPDRIETLTWLLSEPNTVIVNDTIVRHTTANEEIDQDGIYITTIYITIDGIRNPALTTTFDAYDIENIVVISGNDLNYIKAQLGYPLQDSIILTDDQIKELCVKRALRDYFRKFPKIIESESSVGFESSHTFDFPDPLTFGVKDVRVVNKGSVTSRTDSFWNLIKWQSVYGNGSGLTQKGKYGTSYQFDSYGLSNSLMERDVAQSVINKGTVKFRINHTSRQLFVYSEIEGIVNITWARYSNDFNDIKFEQKDDVIDLSASYLKIHAADTAGIYNDDTQDVVFDVDGLRTEGKETKEAILEKWSNYPDVVVIRDSR